MATTPGETNGEHLHGGIREATEVTGVKLFQKNQGKIPLIFQGGERVSAPPPHICDTSVIHLKSGCA